MGITKYLRNREYLNILDDRFLGPSKKYKRESPWRKLKTLRMLLTELCNSLEIPDAPECADREHSRDGRNLHGSSTFVTETIFYLGPPCVLFFT